MLESSEYETRLALTATKPHTAENNSENEISLKYLHYFGLNVQMQDEAETPPSKLDAQLEDGTKPRGNRCA
jgi:hypothetical protein